MTRARTDLEEERRFLLDSILDLEIQYEAGEITKADYDALRNDYTVRAADVLRAIQAYDAPPPLPPPPPPPPVYDEEELGEAFDEELDQLDGLDDDESEPYEAASRSRPAPSRHSSSRRAVAVGLIAGMVLVAVLSVLVIAGDGGSRSPGGAAAPTAIAQRLAKAHEFEAQGEAVEALKQYDAVLKDDPTNVEALTYRGWLLKLAGLVDQAEEYINRALQSDPTYPDAHFFRGMLLFQDRRNPAAAIPEFERYLASNPPPETVQAVQGVLAQARAAAATEPPPTLPPNLVTPVP